MPQEFSPDLNKKYKTTYVKYEKELIYVQGFEDHRDDKGDIYQQLYLSDGKQEKQIPFDEDKLETISPDSCFFNPYPLSSKTKNHKGARKFIRSPKRQWQRSLCENVGALSSPLRHLYGAYNIRIPWDDSTFKFPIVRGLLEQTYPGIDEAMKLVKIAGAIAIGPLHCLTVSSIGTNPLLSSLFGFIGEVDPRTQSIFIHHRPALQETLDFIHRTNQTRWKVVYA